MTIYTPGKIEKNNKDPEVVTEPLTPKEDDDCEAAVSPKLIRVTYFPRNRRTCCVHLLLTIMVMIILACGAIGAVVFYKHINRRAYSGVCGVKYFDSEYSELRGYEADASKMPESEMPSSHYLKDLKEKIEVSPVDDWEYIETPSFDEVRETTVWHDWGFNYTAIIDHQLRRCHIMPLNRTAIAPPTDLVDLLHKLLNGYYFDSARVIREKYNIRNAIFDLSPYGTTVQTKCSRYDSFWIEKVSRVTKRSEDPPTAYAMLSNHNDQELYKIFITQF